MRIAVRNFQIRPIIEASRLRSIVEQTLRVADREADSVSFVFVDDPAMSAYHARYVDVAETTDVLSFPVGEVDPCGERDLGDVVISTDQAARQAAASGHGYPQELEVLALHGLLHLLGYDHERDSGDMQRLEGRLRPLLTGKRSGA